VISSNTFNPVYKGRGRGERGSLLPSRSDHEKKRREREKSGLRAIVLIQGVEVVRRGGGERRDRLVGITILPRQRSRKKGRMILTNTDVILSGRERKRACANARRQFQRLIHARSIVEGKGKGERGNLDAGAPPGTRDLCGSYRGRQAVGGRQRRKEGEGKKKQAALWFKTTNLCDFRADVQKEKGKKDPASSGSQRCWHPLRRGTGKDTEKGREGRDHCSQTGTDFTITFLPGDRGGGLAAEEERGGGGKEGGGNAYRSLPSGKERERGELDDPGPVSQEGEGKRVLIAGDVGKGRAKSATICGQRINRGAWQERRGGHGHPEGHPYLVRVKGREGGGGLAYFCPPVPTARRRGAVLFKSRRSSNGSSNSRGRRERNRRCFGRDPSTLGGGGGERGGDRTISIRRFSCQGGSVTGPALTTFCGRKEGGEGRLISLESRGGFSQFGQNWFYAAILRRLQAGGGEGENTRASGLIVEIDVFKRKGEGAESPSSILSLTEKGGTGPAPPLLLDPEGNMLDAGHTAALRDPPHQKGDSTDE